MIRIRPQPDTVGWHPGFPTVLVAFICWHLDGFYATALLAGSFQSNTAQAWSNLWLLLGFGIAVTAWTFARARQWVTSATGAGFVVSAVALFGRTACELFMGFSHEPLGTLVPGDPAVALVDWIRYGGLVAFVFGLACTGSACAAERRVRRTAPAWVIPP